MVKSNTYETYTYQTSVVRTDGQVGTWPEIVKGTRQGSVSTLDLFNAYK